MCRCRSSTPLAPAPATSRTRSSAPRTAVTVAEPTSAAGDSDLGLRVDDEIVAAEEPPLRQRDTTGAALSAARVAELRCGERLRRVEARQHAVEGYERVDQAERLTKLAAGAE